MLLLLAPVVAGDTLLPVPDTVLSVTAPVLTADSGTVSDSGDSALVRSAQELADSGYTDAAQRILGMLFGAPDRDSLHYLRNRESLQGRSLDETAKEILATADALAAEGLYGAADDLLQELIDPQAGAMDLALEPIPAGAAATGRKKGLEWTVGLSGDYNHIEDRDTLDSLYILSGGANGDWSGSARAGFSWSADSGTVRGISGSFTLASYLVSAEVSSRFSLLWRFLPLTLGVYGNRYLFKSYKDSSDNAGVRVQMAPTTEPLGFPFFFSVPMTFETVRHQSSRPDYADYFRVSTEPGISYDPQSSNRNRGRLSFVYEQVRYQGSDSRLNRIEYGPRLGGLIGNDRVTCSGDLSAVWEQYPLNNESISPDRQVVVQALPELGIMAADFLTIRLPATLQYTRAVHTDTFFTSGDTLYYYMPSGDSTGRSSPFSYRINSFLVTASPGVEWNISDDVQAGVFAGIDYFHTPVKQSVDGKPIGDGIIYLEDSYTAVEPGVSLSYYGESVSGAVNGSYRYENIDDKAAAGRSYATGLAFADSIYIPGEHYSFAQDSRTLDLSIDAQWQVASWITIQISAGCNLRWYAPFAVNGGLTRNYMASLGVDTRF